MCGENGSLPFSLPLHLGKGTKKNIYYFIIKVLFLLNFVFSLKARGLRFLCCNNIIVNSSHYRVSIHDLREESLVSETCQ